ncbi:hypothetical protein [Corynebacterium variabile]|uniref:hypothetical protein n=1 Tax=Corynebacterium variabile TaxID=1727 RepID=UPI003FD293C1
MIPTTYKPFKLRTPVRRHRPAIRGGNEVYPATLWVKVADSSHGTPVMVQSGAVTHLLTVDDALEVADALADAVESYEAWKRYEAWKGGSSAAGND